MEGTRLDIPLRRRKSGEMPFDEVGELPGSLVESWFVRHYLQSTTCAAGVHSGVFFGSLKKGEFKRIAAGAVALHLGWK